MERPHATVALPSLPGALMLPARRAPRRLRKAIATCRQPRRESDRFFRNLVSSMRNGVLAIHRNGTVAELNTEAVRIFQLKRTAHVVGRPFTEVLTKHPDIIRILHSAFDLTNLPNRAEL